MNDSGDSESNEGGRTDGTGTGDRLGGPRYWVLLQVNRWVFTGAVLTVVFLVLVAASRLGLTPLRLIIEEQNGLEYLFSAFIGAIITGTSIVVTINQLVLSQELGAVGKQRERMTEAMEFRQSVEDTIAEDASPPEPAAFLFELVEGVQKRARELEAEVETERDEELRAKIGDYVEDVTGNARSVKSGLEDAQFGTFGVIWHALNFNYSRKIYDARQIRADHADALSADAEEKLDRTIETLKLFGPAREHFKTLYFQWELINLSRALLYISVPALTVVAIMLMYVDGQALPGTFLGIDNLVWVTSVGFVIGISPFVVFITYILRIATVAKRTLAMGPFILRESERDEDLG
ncbi:hypothetical protein CHINAEXTREME_01950 [Halobiforma lacisalsi AJ5]|uniref:Uncharacterized protein n=1 Tax=Natronobacterium lacisalsi AJ5 TaxID=358396 RepID=M0LJD1_NATLA|nr:hypothetical protein [Halobiforma lacisalsi]APW96607.1 hypothetical protein CHINAEXTREME_01950 [Halobiforma lacisalsi AJ5]EMA32110.1 hypothetical protein C445_12386 [Halobiforma lacisalsi AJ5]